jgi:hypothetical protein
MSILTTALFLNYRFIVIPARHLGENRGGILSFQ